MRNRHPSKLYISTFAPQLSVSSVQKVIVPFYRYPGFYRRRILLLPPWSLDTWLAYSLYRKGLDHLT